MRVEDRRGGSSPGVVRELIKLALPLAFIHFSFHLTSLVDTIVAGHLGDVALAGVGLGSSTFFTASIFGLGVGLGLDPSSLRLSGLAGAGTHATRCGRGSTWSCW